MFAQVKLSDGSKLTAHMDEGQLILTNVTGSGLVTWQQSMPTEEARDLRRFLDMQKLD